MNSQKSYGFTEILNSQTPIINDIYSPFINVTQGGLPPFINVTQEGDPLPFINVTLRLLSQTISDLSKVRSAK